MTRAQKQFGSIMTSAPPLSQKRTKIQKEYILLMTLEEQACAEFDGEKAKLIIKINNQLKSLFHLPNANQFAQEKKETMLERNGNPYNAMLVGGFIDGERTFFQGSKLETVTISEAKNKVKNRWKL